MPATSAFSLHASPERPGRSGGWFRPGGCHLHLYLLLLCLVPGCGQPDYPIVEHPPPGKLFAQPDLEVSWQEFQLDQTAPLPLEELTVARLAPKLEFRIGVRGASPLQFVPLNVQLHTASGEPAGGGSGALQAGTAAGQLEGVISVSGPARPGRYRVQVRVQDLLPGPERKLSEWRVLGEAALLIRRPG